MAGQFGHEALAETHYFSIRLAFGIKVRSTLTTAHRQCGQGVFKDLLEAQEFQHAQVYGRVETQASFVGANCAIEFHAVSFVDVYIACVVGPWHSEHNGTFRLHDTLE